MNLTASVPCRSVCRTRPGESWGWREEYLPSDEGGKREEGGRRGEEGRKEGRSASYRVLYSSVLCFLLVVVVLVRSLVQLVSSSSPCSSLFCKPWPNQEASIMVQCTQYVQGIQCPTLVHLGCGLANNSTATLLSQLSPQPLCDAHQVRQSS